MESHLEMAEMGLSSASKPCLATRHRCHTCERTRSIKMRVLAWILGKFSLLLIIVVTSATITFLYHQLLPDDVKHNLSPPSSSPSPNRSAAVKGQADSTPDAQEDQRASSYEQRTEEKPGIRGDHQHQSPAPAVSSSPLTAARLGLFHQHADAHYLSMTDDAPDYFTSGLVRLEDGVLVIQRDTALFLSADVILNSMTSPQEPSKGPSTVIVCLSLGRGDNLHPKPISCQLTYLRQRDQQMARVWMLFQAEANDRIYVSSSWPSYVISDNKDNQESIFTAFEVGQVQRLKTTKTAS